MTNYNAKNERIKREYFRFCREAKRQSVHSIDLAAKAIDRFEVFIKRRDFAKFNVEQAMAFKRYLAEQMSSRTGKSLSPSTQMQTLAALHDLIIWLADQPGYRKSIRYSDAEYFGFPRKDAALVYRRHDPKGPTLDQIRHVLASMPSSLPVHKRDRAIIALIVLTGARDNAVASLRFKHLDLAGRQLNQDAREVRTKASKSMTTNFFPVGPDLVDIVREWISYLSEQHWGPDDPLFPPSAIGQGSNLQFAVVGFSRRCWSDAAPIRKIFRKAFEAAGIPYFNPHSMRNTLARLGVETCTTQQELWVWSQNLGHEQLMTTLGSYGHLDERAKTATMTSLWNSQAEGTQGKTTLFVDADELEVIALFRAASRRSETGPN